ncbi:MAG: hypothetical protein IIA45_01905 [Bacteroidetes bacterium]|nr:hypothetical protein [Bacteroidota bacterium]
MSTFLAIGYLLFFIFLIYRIRFFRIEGIHLHIIAFAFVIKVIAGFVMMMIYTYYYPDRSVADIFKLFDDGKILQGSIFNSPSHFYKLMFGVNLNSPELAQYFNKMEHFVEGNRFIIRYNALLHFISSGSYLVHMTFMCFISLLGGTALLKLFSSVYQNKSKWLLVPFFFLPSLLFWSSGVLKEGVLIFALGFLVYYTVMLGKGKNLVYSILWILITVFVFWQVRDYLLVILFPGLLLLVLWERFKFRRIGLTFLGAHIIYLAILILAGELSPKLNILTHLDTKQEEFFEVVKNKDPSHVLALKNIEPTVPGVIKVIPQALSNSLFRPHILEANTYFIALAAGENLLLILLVILTLLSLSKGTVLPHPLIYFCIYFALFLLVIIGLTVPITGSLVRYKIPAMPFLIAACLILFDINRFRTRWLRGGKQ